MNAFPTEPKTDKNEPYLDEMMKDIVYYFTDGKTKTDITYEDKDDVYTQTLYKWSTDPAKACRKTFALFMTTGAYLNDPASAPLSDTCGSSDPNSTDFSKDTCYAFNTDLSSETGAQKIRTYVVQTSFYGDECEIDADCPTGQGQTCSAGICSSSPDKLIYASRTVGGGEHFLVTDASEFEAKIEEAILNILSTSASASTVATLTTQSRESSTLTQAYFYPKRENTPLKWIGYLRLLWSDAGANLREDTKNSGWLDLKNDNILSFYYDPAAVAYKARTYADADGDLKIDSTSCTVTATKLNDNVLAIWNAQSKLLGRSPDESDSDKRNIKIGIGNTAGVVTSSSCTSSIDTDGNTIYSGFCDFTTTLKYKLDDYWNYASYCSNVTTRWCATGNDCNYCNINKSRTCPGRANSECYYCSLNTTLSCPTVGSVSGCYFNYGTCDISVPLACSDGSSASCTVLDAVCGSGTCKYKCTVDTGRFCSTNAQCIDDYGTCTTDICDVYNTDEAAIAGVDTFTCNADCDAPNCATSVIKYIRGFDKPTPGGSSFRIRSQCTADTDCPGGGSGSCSSKVCSSTGVSCSPTDNCASANAGDVCVGTCSASSTNVLKTLKLGDIVYSTPRISPNSAVNGYDVTYKDTTYSGFVTSRIKESAAPIQPVLILWTRPVLR